MTSLWPPLVTDYSGRQSRQRRLWSSWCFVLVKVQMKTSVKVKEDRFQSRPTALVAVEMDEVLWQRKKPQSSHVILPT